MAMDYMILYGQDWCLSCILLVDLHWEMLTGDFYASYN